MSLFDDLRPPRYSPRQLGQVHPSRAKRRRCACGCRTLNAAPMCAACSYAVNARRKGGDLPAECWCMDTTVWVSTSMIKAGLTRSCGMPECEPIAA